MLKGAKPFRVYLLPDTRDDLAEIARFSYGCSGKVNRFLSVLLGEAIAAWADFFESPAEQPEDARCKRIDALEREIAAAQSAGLTPNSPRLFWRLRAENGPSRSFERKRQGERIDALLAAAENDQTGETATAI